MKRFFKVIPTPNKHIVKEEKNEAKRIGKDTVNNMMETDLNNNLYDKDMSMELNDSLKQNNSIVISDDEASDETDSRGRLVWAKLGGHPWWPAIICDHPDLLRHQRTNKQGVEKTHVQFFENPPSRSWIPSKYCLNYTSSTSPNSSKYLEGDAGQVAACVEADKFIDHTNDERLSLLIVHNKENSNPCDKENSNLQALKTSTPQDTEKKRKLEVYEATCDEYEDPVVQPKKKSKKGRVLNSDSDSDYAPEPDTKSASSDEESSPPPKKKTAAPLAPQKTPKTPKTAARTMTVSPSMSASKAAANLARFSRGPATTAPKAPEAEQYLHHTLKWLKPEHIKDKNKLSRTHEDYDSKTLYVPPDFLNKCTPGMKQWWIIKSQHFDLILFFKVGKFYELYHMDAEVAVKELGLIFMKGAFAHCGFPEKAFGRYSETLVQKGYRVARIEQTERPEAKPKGNKAVNREVCAVITKGTKTHSFLEGQSPEVQNCYLLGVVETGEEIGVCLVDTSVGTFLLSQFSDDRHCSKLRAILAHYNVVQVVYTKREISLKLQSILKLELGQALQEPLVKEREFWNAEKTQRELAAGKYFLDEAKDEVIWPEALRNMTAGETGTFSDEVLDQYKLTLSALGGVIFYLRRCLIERPLLTLKQFTYFSPSQFDVRSASSDFPKPGQTLVLDDTTITNLEIIQTSEGSTEGSLLDILDKCVTAAGKRLLRRWVCAPLCDPVLINERLDAIDNLLSNPGKVKQVQGVLKKVPDLERLLRKIHTIGVKHGPEHPDTRAVLYEEALYGKKKVMDLVNTLDGFETLTKVMKLFEDVELTSTLLKNTVCTGNGFPDLTDLLTFYRGSFDKEEALSNGKIVPCKGVNENYDSALSSVSRIEHQFKDLLTRYKSQLQCSLTYYGTAKNRYQVEVPESAQSRIPRNWEVQSQRKGFVRYYFPEAQKLKVELAEAEIRKEDALKDTMRDMFARFSKHYTVWSKAVRCCATLDVLLSLSQYSASHDTCRPEIRTCPEPVLMIEDGNHPTLLHLFSPGDFIPNHTHLGGGEHKECMIVTGPNMGGKSTLMRQVGLLVILAQVGCRVPAKNMSLSPVDRVFTRLGASDNITRGESTFFVEMSETSTILRHASIHSLVLLDELGRGTATYDGTAIASSVIHHVTNDIRCRTLFSTHYHRLVDELGETDTVTLSHMSCMNNNEEDEQDITFLYKLSNGPCPKSFGFNAAKLAGVPIRVISEAQKIATQFETFSDKFHLFSKCVKSSVAEIDVLCEKLSTVVAAS